MSDMMPLYQIDHSDSTFHTYLKLYSDHIEIKKPRKSKYNGLLGAGRLAFNILGVIEADYLEAVLGWDDIEKVIFKPATKSFAGIIQFYLFIPQMRTKATYFDVDYRADAINFKYAENDTALKIKEYVECHV